MLRTTNPQFLKILSIHHTILNRSYHSGTTWKQTAALGNKYELFINILLKITQLPVLKKISPESDTRLHSCN